MMYTYLNDSHLKTAFLAEITKHEAQDQFINAFPWRTAELGLPTWFAHIEDYVFENLPENLSKTWPRRLAEAIPVGAVVDDLALVKILRWGLADAEFGVRHATDDEAICGCIDVIVAVFDAEIATEGHATAEQCESAARAAKAARAIWAAWDVCDDKDAQAAKVARAAWAAWDAWDAKDAKAAAAWDDKAARAARAIWAAWDVCDDKKIVKKANTFCPALSEFVLRLVRSLPVQKRGGIAPAYP